MIASQWLAGGANRRGRPSSVHPMLAIRNVSKQFGGLSALHDVSFDVSAGSVVGIMGANGAGKTTLFSLIAGNQRPNAGRIEFDGRLLNGLRPDQICRLGVARTFQIVKPFGQLTVMENLRTAALFGKAAVRNAGQADARSLPVLEAIGLARTADQRAATLTLSDQKRLEVARAIASGARLVLLDEVMAGLTPTEVAQMLLTLRQLKQAYGLTLIVIEHVMRALMDLCERIIVLHHGQLIAEGSPASIAEDPRVLAAYFGAAP